MKSNENIQHAVAVDQYVLSKLIAIIIDDVFHHMKDQDHLLAIHIR